MSLDHQIRFARQVAKNIAGARMLQVQRHAELVPQPIKGRHRDVVGPFPSELHTAQAKVRCVVSNGSPPAGF